MKIMKTETSGFLKFLASVLMSFPLSYLLLVAILFDIPARGCIHILLTPSYYFTVLVMVVTGYGLWGMQRWSWYSFIVGQCLMTYENTLFLIYFSESHHKFLVYILSMMIQLFLVYRIMQEVRVPYFFPKIRWWESNPKYRFSESVILLCKDDKEIEGKLLDVSATGCFVQTPSSFEDEETILLSCQVFGYDLSCSGKVVWRVDSTVTHPKGIGIKFHNLDRIQKKNLNSIQRILKKMGLLYRRSRYWMSEKDYLEAIALIQSAEWKRSHKKEILNS